MHHSNRFVLKGSAALLLALLGLYLAFTAMNISAAPLHSEANVTTSRSDEDGLKFTISVPEVEISAEGAVSAAGLDGMLSQPGEPELPYYSTLIALPPEADATVTVKALTTENMRVENVRPVADIANHEQLVNGEYVTNLDTLGKVYLEDAAIYSADSAYPAATYELSEPMYLRDLRVVELKVYPVRYNPASETLTHIHELSVDVSFSGAKMSRGSATAKSAGVSYANVLNVNESAEWHALPTAAPTMGIQIPVGSDAFKIEVSENGIYEISYSDLQAAGMPVASVNPNTLQMMHRGNVVAYQFVGNGNNTFEPTEKILFYGWAFDGSHYEEQYIGDNIFWIWANGSPANVQTLINPVGYPVANAFPESITFAENNLWMPTYTDEWAFFDVTDADTWYWDKWERQDMTRTYTIDLPYPATVGANAQFSAQVFSGLKHDNHSVHAALNGSSASKTWNSINAVEISGAVPLSALNNGNNTFTLYSDTTNAAGAAINSDLFYTNEITVDYMRQLIATGNELEFGYDTVGSHQFNISGFTTNSAADMLVWEVSDPYSPNAITISASDISGSAAPYTLRVAADHVANAKYIATTGTNAALNPASIVKYTASSINPAGGAEWVAIAHNSLLAPTNDLAAHRASASNLTTHVVDVNDVYMQYGYGFAMPEALQNYMKHAVANWSTKPQYLMIAGDATHNPLLQPCPVHCTTWSTTEQTLVVTDLLVADRFLGLIPTDHTFSMLVGNDILPDISVGRIASKTSAEMQNTVDKIKEYEDSIAADESWTQELLFLADNKDQGGDFCAENESVVASYLPTGFNNTSYCLDKYLYQHDSAGNTMLDSSGQPIPLTDSSGSAITQPIAKAQLRADFYGQMGTSSAGIINYRGHGSIQDWAGGLVQSINDAEWTNLGKPTVILSADCLDGNFAWPDRQALSEEFMSLNNMRGSAAHWSSTGLGYSFEHTALHIQFYEGLYANNLGTIGDAINYSKSHYISNGSGDISEVYAFTLQGDPAMGMPNVGGSTGFGVYLPILTR